jgi:CheY-like chemotaxis protein
MKILENENYQNFKYFKIKENIDWIYRYMIAVGLLISFACMIPGFPSPSKNFVFYLIFYVTSVKIAMILIRKETMFKWTKVFGIIFFIIINILSFCYSFTNKVNNFEILMPETVQIMSMTVSILFISSFKTQLFLQISQRIFLIGIKLYLSGKIFTGEVIQMITTLAYYSILSVAYESNLIKLFDGSNLNFINSIVELSKCIDKIAENILILNYDKNNYLNFYQGSSDFFQKFKKYEESNIEKVLNEFIHIREEDLLIIKNLSESKFKFNGASYNFNKDLSYTLYHDILNYLEEENNVKDSKYHVNYYAKRKIDEENNEIYEFFEVKYVVFSSNLYYDADKKFLLMLFRNIEYETFHSKIQQLTTFGNILISSLTHELKNPLNALYGIFYSFESDSEVINKKLNMIENLVKRDQEKYNEDIEMNYLLGDIKKHFQKIPMVAEKYYSKLAPNLPYSTFSQTMDESISSKLKTLLLSLNLYFFDTFNSNLKYSKYLISKINLILANFEIFSKSRLKLSIQTKNSETNLYTILNKCFKILYPMIEFNNNYLNLDIYRAKTCMIKTDVKFFKILLKNIIIIFEKRSRRSDLEISVRENPGNKDNPIFSLCENKLDIILELKNMFSLDDSIHKLSNEDLDIIDVFRKNNKIISQLIECDYTEIFSEADKILKYIITVPYYSQNFSHLVKRTESGNSLDSLKTPQFSIEENEDKKVSLSTSEKFKDSKSFKKSFPTNRNICSIEEPNFSGSDNFCWDLEDEPKSEYVKSIMVDDIFQIFEKDKKKETKTNLSMSDIKDITLLVDDDSLSIKNTLNLLKEQKNNKIITATNGQDAVEKVRSIIEDSKVIDTHINLTILMDIYMPVMNGIESSKLIQKELENFTKLEKNCNINCKLYFVSGNSASQFTKLIEEISLFSGYFEKPIKKKDIINLFKN